MVLLHHPSHSTPTVLSHQNNQNFENEPCHVAERNLRFILTDAADAAEWQRLLLYARRTTVRDVIREHIRELESKIPPSAAPAAAAEEKLVDPTPSKSSLEAPATGTSWESIPSFAWDQDDNRVRIFITSGVDGVGSLDQEKDISLDCTQDSFDLKIRGLNGKNLRLYRSNLDKEINPSECRLKIKENQVTISLKKKDKWSHFYQLVAKRPKRAAPSAKSLESDPSSGIMDVLKDIYEEGDDTTKRTIAEAFDKARRGEKTSTMPGDEF